MPALEEVLARAADEGHLTEQAAADGVAHCAAARWVGGILGPTPHCVDLGAGGGLPALPLACAWPRSRWVLAESRGRRASFLRWAVRALDLDARVAVHEGDVDALTDAGRWDLVSARGFGTAAVVAEVAALLLGEGGLLVVSEPPEGDRWDRAGCVAMGVVPLLTSHTAEGRWRVLIRVGSSGPPRRRVRRMREAPRFV